jgi:hypothetical protein
MRVGEVIGSGPVERASAGAGRPFSRLGGGARLGGRPFACPLESCEASE